MPRTLDPILSAALDSAAFEPIIRGWMGDDQERDTEIQILKYKINKTDLEVTFYTEEQVATEITIERGARVNGVEYTVFSMPFSIYQLSRTKKIYKAKGRIGENSYYTIAGDQQYDTIINNWAGAISSVGFTLTYQNASAAWKDYQFLPDGKFVILNNSVNLLGMILQKYFIYITDYNGVTPLIFSIDDTFNRALDHTVQLNDNDTWDEQFLLKNLRWVDENGTYHVTTGGSFGYHHLGYLESTADEPEAFPSNIGGLCQCKGRDLLVTLPFHLKYVTGDKIKFTSPDGSTNFTTALDVTEVFEAGAKEKAWKIELRALQFLNNTEGGSMPSTIERVSNYTPLNTSAFDGVLSSQDNNLQAAMETIDDHEHGSSYTDESIQDLIAAMIEDGEHDGLIITYDDVGNIINIEVDTSFIADLINNAMPHSGMFNDAEGNSSALAATATDGTSTYSARRDHVHNGPVAVVNANNIFQCNAAGGSAFSGTISGAPSGATVVYNAGFSGNENALVPASTSQLGKMRLYNTTRGNSALISNSNTGTNTITLTANAPANWANGDTITIASQTVSGGGFNWVDIEITSGDYVGKSFVNLYLSFSDSGGAGQTLLAHPFETFAASKLVASVITQSTQFLASSFPFKLVSNIISIHWSASGASTATIVIRQNAYLY